jgi:Tfp pilus assembly protein PilV
MDSAMKSCVQTGARNLQGQRGFTLLETVIAGLILAVGLLAMLAVFSTALAATQSTQEDQIARQKVKEALENIFTARGTQQVSFDQIRNLPNGIFVTGFQPLTGAGPDGLVGTIDDIPVANCPNGVECVTLPGPDGILGSSDDVVLPLTNYQRKIEIQDVLNPDGTVNDNLREITVTVQYNGAQHRSYSVTALISSYR